MTSEQVFTMLLEMYGVEYVMFETLADRVRLKALAKSR